MTSLSRFFTDDDDKVRIRAARIRQDYDHDTPRCFTCVYFKRGAMNPERARKRGSQKVVVVDTCGFGNFPTSHHGLCDEWRTRGGQRLEKAGDS